MSPNVFDVTGKTVLVTGASRGIGRALALGFREAGAIVIGTGSRPASVEWMKDNGIVPAVANMTEPDALQSLIAETVRAHGRLDCLINNAGINANVPASATKEETMEELLAVNVKGVFRACQAYHKAQRKNGGVIINVASVGGFLGAPLNVVYSATKGAVLQLTRSLALEWAGSGFRVNALCPGIIDTEMSSRVTASEAYIKKAEALIPLCRLGQPEDMVGPALFMASDASAYMTGQLVVVDGGYSAQ